MHTSATFFFFFLHSLNSTFQWPEAQNPSNWQRISTRRARYFRSCKGIRPIPVVRSHDFFSFAGYETPRAGWRRGACNSYNPFMRCTPSKRSRHALGSAAHTQTCPSATVETDSTFFLSFGLKNPNFSVLLFLPSKLAEEIDLRGRSQPITYGERYLI